MEGERELLIMLVVVGTWNAIAVAERAPERLRRWLLQVRASPVPLLQGVALALALAVTRAAKHFEIASVVGAMRTAQRPPAAISPRPHKVG